MSGLAGQVAVVTGSGGAMGGANSDAGVARAARLADGWLARFGDRLLPAVAARAAAYREQAKEHGRPATLCLLRLVGIDASRDRVESDWRSGGMLRGYRHAGAPGERSERAAASLPERREMTLDSFGDMLVAGTPDDCVARLKACAELTGCEYVLVTFRGPDADEQLDLFGPRGDPGLRPRASI